MKKLPVSFIFPVLVVACAVSVKAQQPTPITVFIFTEQSAEGFVDDGQKQRQDTVNDMTTELRKRKRTIQLVEDRSKAQVVLEVVDRKRVATGNTSTETFHSPGASTKPEHLYSKTTVEKVAEVVVRLSVGNYETEIVAKNKPEDIAPWRFAAYYATNGVENWIKTNRTRIPVE